MDINKVKLSGTIIKVDLDKVGKKDTSLLQVLLEQKIKTWDDEDAVQITPIQCLGRKADELYGGLKAGQQVGVTAKLDAREWQDRHFINCTILEIKILADAAPVAQGSEDYNRDYFPNPANPTDDELPF